MRFLGMTAPELLVILATSVIPVLVLYWTVRFAVKHGMRDAMAESGDEEGSPRAEA